MVNANFPSLLLDHSGEGRRARPGSMLWEAGSLIWGALVLLAVLTTSLYNASGQEGPRADSKTPRTRRKLSSYFRRRSSTEDSDSGAKPTRFKTRRNARTKSSAASPPPISMHKAAPRSVHAHIVARPFRTPELEPERTSADREKKAVANEEKPTVFETVNAAKRPAVARAKARKRKTVRNDHNYTDVERTAEAPDDESQPSTSESGSSGSGTSMPEYDLSRPQSYQGSAISGVRSSMETVTVKTSREQLVPVVQVQAEEALKVDAKGSTESIKSVYFN